MLILAARRARAQWPLLSSLLVVLVIGTTLLGTSALLITQTSQRAVEVSATRADPDDVTVTAYVSGVGAADARSVADDTRSVLTSSVAPFTATTVTRASSAMRLLPVADDAGSGVKGGGYLAGIEDLPARAALVSGRWPQKPREAAVLQSTARLLGLKVGDPVRLGAELGRDPRPPVTVVVAAVVRPLQDAGWDRDPLGGAGYDPDPAESTSARQIHAYGPFLVDLDELFAGGSALSRLEVSARPDLSAPTSRGLDELTASLLRADRRLGGTLGDRIEIERVSSPLPQVLINARNQQQLTSGAVLALAVIGLLLTVIALALAVRLTTGVRTGESDLLAAIGISRRQFTAVAAAEAGGIAVLAVALAVPGSSLLYSALTHLPPLAGAGLTAGVTVTAAQLLVVVCGAVGLAGLHMLLATRPATGSGDRRSQRELLARSGLDVLLLGLAAVGWWQLRSQPAAGGYRADAVRVLAPALILAAGAAVALRILPPLLRLAERLAGRARGFTPALAASGAARRPQALAAGLLICLGCAAATFGTAFGSTWQTSQRDQADLSVGTDLAVSLAAVPVTGQSAVVREATGGTVGPVARQNIVVGQWLGGPDSVPRLVAVDTRHADALLRGRIDDDRDWAEVTGPLRPSAPVTGVALPRNGSLTLTGTVTGSKPVTVSPQLILEDATGLRTACTPDPLPLDGRRHPIAGCAPIAGLRLVGVALPILGETGVQHVAAVDATLTLPAAGTDSGPAGPAWSVRPASTETSQLNGEKVSFDGVRLRLSAAVSFADPTPASRVLVATAFPDPGPIPVVVSSRFAATVGAHRGSELTFAVDQTAVDAVVSDIVPQVPSAPGAAAVLADVDSLTRVMAVRGNVNSPVTDWWVGDPARADAAERAGALRLGAVSTRTGETDRLTGSPLRASYPAVLRVLVVAAVVLLLGGVLLHVVCDVQARAVEVARLRGIGVSRNGIRAALIGEHALVVLPLLAAGTGVGALASYLVAPLLIRSDTGAAAVPAAVAHWPWGAEAILLAVLVGACALAVGAAVFVQASRADAAHLRVAS
ncbi:ABC transporter permease [Actinoplanes sp. LDG1-06]|uniref:ABC transporter permease n=1 Tax=Paractinoplanes ovalisporus TaxID=2810368 RepID=A0ABS2AL53_9ACTN|nr:ABC transporter permease [Actinoplanes ovalisporus]MBM2620597.1 ABC transporter permease [Actinoplanes ovalisporus]